MSPREARKLWAEALESGEFKQGTGSLHPTQDRYCCLGVLCVLAGRDGVQAEWRNDDEDLPPVVMSWVGLSDPSGGWEASAWAVSDCLAGLNDNGTRFRKIAAIIRSEPEGMFVEEAAS